MSLLCKCRARWFELGVSLCFLRRSACETPEVTKAANLQLDIRLRSWKRLWKSAESVKMLITSGTYVAFLQILHGHGKEVHLVASMMLTHFPALFRADVFWWPLRSVVGCHSDLRLKCESLSRSGSGEQAAWAWVCCLLAVILQVFRSLSLFSNLKLLKWNSKKETAKLGLSFELLCKTYHRFWDQITQ